MPNNIYDRYLRWPKVTPDFSKVARDRRRRRRFFSGFPDQDYDGPIRMPRGLQRSRQFEDVDLPRRFPEVPFPQRGLRRTPTGLIPGQVISADSLLSPERRLDPEPDRLLDPEPDRADPLFSAPGLLDSRARRFPQTPAPPLPELWYRTPEDVNLGPNAVPSSPAPEFGADPPDLESSDFESPNYFPSDKALRPLEQPPPYWKPPGDRRPLATEWPERPGRIGVGPTPWPTDREGPWRPGEAIPEDATVRSAGRWEEETGAETLYNQWVASSAGATREYHLQRKSQLEQIHNPAEARRLGQRDAGGLFGRISDFRGEFGAGGRDFGPVSVTPLGIPDQELYDDAWKGSIDALTGARNPDGSLSEGEVGPYDQIITQESALFGVRPELVRAVIMAESSFVNGQTSDKGAEGLGQLMPAMQEAFGVTDPFDPRDNIRGTTKFLRYLLDLYDGDEEKAIAAYNAGETALRKNATDNDYRTLPGGYKEDGTPWGWVETHEYVPKVQGYLEDQAVQMPGRTQFGDILKNAVANRWDWNTVKPQLAATDTTPPAGMAWEFRNVDRPDDLYVPRNDDGTFVTPSMVLPSGVTKKGTQNVPTAGSFLRDRQLDPNTKITIPESQEYLSQLQRARAELQSADMGGAQSDDPVFRQLVEFGERLDDLKQSIEANPTEAPNGVIREVEWRQRPNNRDYWDENVRPPSIEQVNASAATTMRRTDELFHDMGLSFLSGVVGVGNSAVGLVDAIGLSLLGTSVRDIRRALTPDYLDSPFQYVSLKDIQDQLESYQSETGKAARKRLGEADNASELFATLMEYPGIVSTLVAEMIPHLYMIRPISMGLSRAAGSTHLLGRLGRAFPQSMRRFRQSRFGDSLGRATIRGGISEGLLSAGSNAYDVQLQSGENLTPGQSAMLLASGATTGLITMASGRVARQFGILDPETLLAGGLRNPRGMSNWAGAVALAGLFEGVGEEFPQSFTEQVASNLALGQPPLDGALVSGLTGMIPGAVLGAGMQSAHEIQAGHQRSKENRVRKRLLRLYDDQTSTYSRREMALQDMVEGEREAATGRRVLPYSRNEQARAWRANQVRQLLNEPGRVDELNSILMPLVQNRGVDLLNRDDSGDGKPRAPATTRELTMQANLHYWLNALDSRYRESVRAELAGLGYDAIDEVSDLPNVESLLERARERKPVPGVPSDIQGEPRVGSDMATRRTRLFGVAQGLASDIRTRRLTGYRPFTEAQVAFVLSQQLGAEGRSSLGRDTKRDLASWIQPYGTGNRSGLRVWGSRKAREAVKDAAIQATRVELTRDINQDEFLNDAMNMPVAGVAPTPITDEGATEWIRRMTLPVRDHIQDLLRLRNQLLKEGSDESVAEAKELFRPIQDEQMRRTGPKPSLLGVRRSALGLAPKRQEIHPEIGYGEEVRAFAEHLVAQAQSLGIGLSVQNDTLLTLSARIRLARYSQEAEANVVSRHLPVNIALSRLGGEYAESMTDVQGPFATPPEEQGATEDDPTPKPEHNYTDESVYFTEEDRAKLADVRMRRASVERHLFDFKPTGQEKESVQNDLLALHEEERQLLGILWDAPQQAAVVEEPIVKPTEDESGGPGNEATGGDPAQGAETADPPPTIPQPTRAEKVMYRVWATTQATREEKPAYVSADSAKDLITLAHESGVKIELAQDPSGQQAVIDSYEDLLSKLIAANVLVDGAETADQLVGQAEAEPAQPEAPVAEEPVAEEQVAEEPDQIRIERQALHKVLDALLVPDDSGTKHPYWDSLSVVELAMTPGYPVSDAKPNLDGVVKSLKENILAFGIEGNRAVPDGRGDTLAPALEAYLAALAKATKHGTKLQKAARNLGKAVAKLIAKNIASDARIMGAPTETTTHTTPAAFPVDEADDDWLNDLEAELGGLEDDSVEPTDGDTGRDRAPGEPEVSPGDVGATDPGKVVGESSGVGSDVSEESRDEETDGGSVADQGDGPSQSGESLGGRGDTDRAADGDAGSGHVGTERGADGDGVSQSEKEAAAKGKPAETDFFAIAPSDVRSSVAQRVTWNIEAIETLDKLGWLKNAETTQRPPTYEEKVALARYTGWNSRAMRQFLRGTGEYAGSDQRRILTRLIGEDLMKQLDEQGTLEAPIGTELPHLMWHLAQALGFKGGTVFDPAVGIGNLFGAMPPSMAFSQSPRTTLTGVSQDIVQASIANALYGWADIKQGHITESSDVIPQNFYDLVMSHVPWDVLGARDRAGRRTGVAAMKRGDIRDPRFAGRATERRYLHDYYLQKALDSARPEGLVIVTMPTEFMDRQNAQARQSIAKRARLLYAIRLPAQTLPSQDDPSPEARIEGEAVDLLVFQKASPQKPSMGRMMLGRLFHDRMGNISHSNDQQFLLERQDHQQRWKAFTDLGRTTEIANLDSATFETTKDERPLPTISHGRAEYADGGLNRLYSDWTTTYEGVNTLFRNEPHLVLTFTRGTAESGALEYDPINYRNPQLLGLQSNHRPRGSDAETSFDERNIAPDIRFGEPTISSTGQHTRSADYMSGDAVPLIERRRGDGFHVLAEVEDPGSQNAQLIGSMEDLYLSGTSGLWRSRHTGYGEPGQQGESVDAGRDQPASEFGPRGVQLFEQEFVGAGFKLQKKLAPLRQPYVAAHVLGAVSDLRAAGSNTYRAQQADPAPQRVTTERVVSEEGSLRIEAGVPMRLVGDRWQVVGKESQKVVKAYIPVKNALRALLERQRSAAQETPILDNDGNVIPDSEAPPVNSLRKRLVRAYEAFVKVNGPFHKASNRKKIGLDPYLSRVAGLEILGKDYTPPAPKDVVKGLSDIFKRDTTRYLIPPEATSQPDPADVLKWSLVIHGAVNPEYMAQIYKPANPDADPATELEAALWNKIFFNPQSQVWETDAEYLSGDVVEKLAYAREAVKHDLLFRKNVVALEQSQPEMIVADLDRNGNGFSAQFGSPWVPSAAYVRFIQFWGGATDEMTTGDIRLINNGGVFRYVVTGDAMNWARFSNSALPEAVGRKGTGGAKHFGEFIQEALNQKVKTIYTPADEVYPPVYNKEGKAIRVKDEAATDAYMQALKDLRESWETWWTKQPDVVRELTTIYNAQYNVWVEPEWDGSHLQGKDFTAFDGIAEGKSFRPFQLDAIWRAMKTGNLSLFWDTGAGKTLVMLGTAMQYRRLGYAHKPMMVAPSHVVEQHRAELLQYFPNANVLVVGTKDLGKKRKAHTQERIVNGDWDLIIIDQHAWKRLDAGPQEFESKIQEMKDGLQELVLSLHPEKTVEWFQDLMRRRMEQGGAAATLDERKLLDPGAKQAIADLSQMLQTLANRAAKKAEKQADGTGNLIFDSLNIDMLIVDEAHMFKNLWFKTAKGAMVGVSPTNSARALNHDLKVRGINRKTNYHNVMFATATPISRSIAEGYTFSRYMNDRDLQRLGIDSFDAWANTFATSESNVEPAPTPGQYTTRTRLRHWRNLSHGLSRIMARWSSVMTSQDVRRELSELGAPVVIPSIRRDASAGWDGKAKNVISKPHPLWDRYMHGITQRIERMKEIGTIDAQDNMLKVMQDVSAAAIDLRLKDESAHEDLEQGRLSVASRNIADVYQRYSNVTFDDGETGDGTQIVFLDLGVPKGKVPDLPRNVQDVDLTEAEIREAEEAAAEAEEAQKEREADAADQEETGSQEDVPPDIKNAPPPDTIDTNLYQMLREKLVKAGIPDNEIVFRHQAPTPVEEARVYKAMQAGKIRVFITNKDTGFNVQDRLVALHHLDVPYNPDTLIQREGRMFRQGNKFKEVELYRYLTQKSFDEFRWNLVSEKQRMINWFLEGNLNQYDDSDPSTIDYAEASAISSGDVRSLEYQRKNTDLNKLRVAQANWQQAFDKAEDTILKSNKLQSQSLHIQALLEVMDEEWHDWKDKGTQPVVVTRIPYDAGAHVAAGSSSSDGWININDVINLPDSQRGDLLGEDRGGKGWQRAYNKEAGGLVFSFSGEDAATKKTNRVMFSEFMNDLNATTMRKAGETARGTADFGTAGPFILSYQGQNGVKNPSPDIIPKLKTESQEWVVDGVSFSKFEYGARTLVRIEAGQRINPQTNKLEVNKLEIGQTKLQPSQNPLDPSILNIDEIYEEGLPKSFAAVFYRMAGKHFKQGIEAEEKAREKMDISNAHAQRVIKEGTFQDADRLRRLEQEVRWLSVQLGREHPTPEERQRLDIENQQRAGLPEDISQLKRVQLPDDVHLVSMNLDLWIKFFDEGFPDPPTGADPVMDAKYADKTLKQLWYLASQLVHPDRGDQSNLADQRRRTAWMQRVNAANSDGDTGLLAAILRQWDTSGDLFGWMNTNRDLVTGIRLLRQHIAGGAFYVPDTNRLDPAGGPMGILFDDATGLDEIRLIRTALQMRDFKASWVLPNMTMQAPAEESPDSRAAIFEQLAAAEKHLMESTTMGASLKAHRFSPVRFAASLQALPSVDLGHLVTDFTQYIEELDFNARWGDAEGKRTVTGREWEELSSYQHALENEIWRRGSLNQVPLFEDTINLGADMVFGTNNNLPQEPVLWASGDPAVAQAVAESTDEDFSSSKLVRPGDPGFRAAWRVTKLEDTDVPTVSRFPARSPGLRAETPVSDQRPAPREKRKQRKKKIKQGGLGFFEPETGALTPGPHVNRPPHLIDRLRKKWNRNVATWTPERILRELENLMNVPAMGKGQGANQRLGGNWLGLYYFGGSLAGTIKLQSRAAISVAAHEFGHHIGSKVMGIRHEGMAWTDEMVRIGQRTSLPTYTPSQVFAEAEAEFFRMWLTNPNEAQIRAPLYFMAFEQALKNFHHQGWAKGLRRIQYQMLAWHDKPLMEKSMWNVSTGAADAEGLGAQPFGASASRAKRTWDYVERQFFQRRAPLRDAVNFFSNALEGTGRVPLNYQDNAFYLAESSDTSERKAEFFLREGVHFLDLNDKFDPDDIGLVKTIETLLARTSKDGGIKYQDREIVVAEEELTDTGDLTPEAREKMQQTVPLGGTEAADPKTTVNRIDRHETNPDKILHHFSHYLVVSHIAMDYGRMKADQRLPLPWDKDKAQFMMEQYDKIPGFQEARERVQAYSDGLLLYMTAGGLVDPESTVKMKSHYMMYMPLQRLRNRLIDEGHLSGRSYGNMALRSLGRPFTPSSLRSRKPDVTNPVIDPLESLVANTLTIVAEVEKQRAVRAFVRQAFDLGKITGGVAMEGGGLDPTDPENVPYKGNIKAVPGAGAYLIPVPPPMEAKDINLEQFKSEINAIVAEAMMRLPYGRAASASGMKAVSALTEEQEKKLLKELDLNEMVTAFMPTTFTKDGKNYISTIVKGKRRWFHVPNQALFDSLALGPPEMPSMLQSKWIARPLEGSARLLRATATSTLEFMIRNPLKDTVAAFMFSRYGFVPVLDTLKGMANILAYNADEVRRSYLSDPDNPPKLWFPESHEIVRKFLGSGAGGYTIWSGDRDFLRKAMKQLGLGGERSFIRGLHLFSEMDAPARLRFMRSIPHGMLDGLQAFQEALENASRLGEFKRGMAAEGAMQASDADAEILARASRAAAEVTVNFRRGGDFSLQMNRMQSFFNSGIQGKVRLAEVVKRDPVGFLARGSGLTLFTFALAALNWDDDEYWELSDEERSSYWHMRVGTDEMGRANWLRIPKPWELGDIFGNIPQAMFEQWAGQLIKDGKLSGRGVRGGDRGIFGHLFAPLGQRAMPRGPLEISPEGNWTQFAWSALQYTFPTFILPLIQAAGNFQAFTGRYIVNPYDMLSGRKRPWELGNAWTSEPSKTLSRWLYQSSDGAVSVPAGIIDSLVYGYTAGIGRYGMNLIERVQRLVGGGEYPTRTSMLDTPPERLVGLRAIYTTNLVNTSSSSVNRLYEVDNRTQRVEAQWRDARDRGDEKALGELEEELAPLRRLAPRIKNARESLGDLFNLAEEVMAALDMDPDLKDRYLINIRGRVVDKSREALGLSPLYEHIYNSKAPWPRDAQTHGVWDNFKRLILGRATRPGKTPARETEDLIGTLRPSRRRLNPAGAR